MHPIPLATGQWRYSEGGRGRTRQLRKYTVLTLTRGDLGHPPGQKQCLGTGRGGVSHLAIGNRGPDLERTGLALFYGTGKGGAALCQARYAPQATVLRGGWQARAV